MKTIWELVLDVLRLSSLVHSSSPGMVSSNVYTKRSRDAKKATNVICMPARCDRNGFATLLPVTAETFANPTKLGTAARPSWRSLVLAVAMATPSSCSATEVAVAMLV